MFVSSCGHVAAHTSVLSSCVSWLRSMVAAGTPGVAAPSPGGVLVGGLECKKDIF